MISIKSSDISEMTAAAELVSAQSDYPLHLGVTEAGDDFAGLIKNSMGIGALLLRGIGDTIRVSLTADPVTEVSAGKEILKSLGLYEAGGIDIVSCPTCGRTKIDLIDISKKYRAATENIRTNGKRLTVAIMGCAVNGPGEAREADFGIAGGDGYALLFRHGETVRKVDEDKVIETLMEETYNALKYEVHYGRKPNLIRYFQENGTARDRDSPGNFRQCLEYYRKNQPRTAHGGSGLFSAAPVCQKRHLFP